MLKKVLINVCGGDLAGGGIASMFRESLPGFVSMCDRQGWKLLSVSSEPNSATNRQFVFNSAEYAERHMEAARFVERLMGDLGNAEAGVFVWGYTSYFPNAFQPYVRTGQVKLVWADSSPPDTDQLNANIRTGRFVAEAYAGTTAIVWCWHDFNETDARLVSRVPPGVRLAKTSRPFPADYLRSLQVTGSYPAWAYRDQADLATNEVVIVLSSSDYWSPCAAGKWMTHDQWREMWQRTELLLDEMEVFGELLSRQGKTLVLVADPALSQVRPSARNFRLRFQKFQPRTYRHLLRAADAVILRTTCCVTATECAWLGVPQYLWLTPTQSYMNVEVMADAARERNLILPIGAAFGRESREDVRAAVAKRAFAEAERFNRENSFFRTLEKLL